MASSSGSSFKELHEETTKNLVAITRTVNQLEAEDINFHRSLDPQIGKKIDEQNARLIELAKMLTRAAQRDTDEPVVLRTTEDIDDNWSAQVDVIDGLLERANRSLDEYSGILGRGLAMPHGVKRKQAPEELADEKGRSMKTGKLPKVDTNDFAGPDAGDTDVLREININHRIVSTSSLGTIILNPGSLSSRQSRMRLTRSMRAFS